jgi:hypothetical protein
MLVIAAERGEVVEKIGGEVRKVFAQVRKLGFAGSLCVCGGCDDGPEALIFFAVFIYFAGCDGMSRVLTAFATKTQRHEDGFWTIEAHGAIRSFHRGEVRPLCAHTEK